MEIRPASEADTPAILELLAASLGWATDARFQGFFTWKHEANPFGASARWVALDEGRVIGFRAFLRWDLERAGRRLRAVRAVDTATAPDAQGRGVFRELTLHAVESLTRDGVDLVFNTPNDRSGPGYLSMGWTSLGRVRRRVRPRSLAGAWRLLRAHGGEGPRWSEPATVGVAADEALHDPAVVEAMLVLRPPSPQVRTACSVAYLRWRYAGAIPARVVVHLDGPERGVAFVRVRRRGDVRVAVLGDVVVPDGDPALERAVVRRVATSVDADGTAGLGRLMRGRDGFLPIGGRGPQLVTRALASDPPTSLDSWDLGYGDLELL